MRPPATEWHYLEKHVVVREKVVFQCRSNVQTHARHHDEA
jgi:hypothetical protein